MMTYFVILVVGLKFENFHLLLLFLHDQFFETLKLGSYFLKIGVFGSCLMLRVIL